MERSGTGHQEKISLDLDRLFDGGGEARLPSPSTNSELWLRERLEQMVLCTAPTSPVLIHRDACAERYLRAEATGRSIYFTMISFDLEKCLGCKQGKKNAEGRQEVSIDEKSPAFSVIRHRKNYQPRSVVLCPLCGDECSGNQGLSAHMKGHRNRGEI